MERNLFHKGRRIAPLQRLPYPVQILFSRLYLEKRRLVGDKFPQEIRMILRPYLYGDSGEFYICSLHHVS